MNPLIKKLQTLVDNKVIKSFHLKEEVPMSDDEPNMNQRDELTIYFITGEKLSIATQSSGCLNNTSLFLLT